MELFSMSKRNAIILPIVVSFLAAAFLPGCSRLGALSPGSESATQVAITNNPSGKVLPGMFVWHDLLTPDLRSAGEFYQNLFNWQVEYQKDAAFVRNDGKLIATIVAMKSSTDKARGTWIPSVSVKDVDAAAAKVKLQGGTVLKGPADMGKRGRAALIRDSQGADILLLRSPGGDPPMEEATIGAWLWDEIWSSNPEKTAVFYTEVLGCDEVQSIKDDYGVFTFEGEPLAGIRHLEVEARHLRWVPVVRVADPEATCRKAEALGGVVRVRPEDAPNVGNTALISDPTGALILIQRWPSEPADGGN
ncbi:MAG: VOC family protein [Desulfocapsaceae bacterium]